MDARQSEIKAKHAGIFRHLALGATVQNQTAGRVSQNVKKVASREAEAAEAKLK